PFLGTTRELANRIAERCGYPLALSGREDLPQVAQFLKTLKNEFVTRDEVIGQMIEAICRRWPELHLRPDPDLPPETALRELLVAAWKAYQQERPLEPHRYLAGLRKIKTLITTNPVPHGGHTSASTEERSAQ